MARPRCCRRITGEPAYQIFKPAGVPSSALEEIGLSIDEFEAVRLADLEGLYQEEAARRMGISRATFGRILQEARRKIARAIVEGLALRLEGMESCPRGGRVLGCAACGHSWQPDFGAGRPSACPVCCSPQVQRLPEDERALEGKGAMARGEAGER